MAFQIILLLILLVCSAFFSGAETALFALSRHEISRLQRDSRRTHRLAGQLLRRPRQLLLTLMIGNVTINMFIFAASLGLFQTLAGKYTVIAPVLGLAAPIVVTLFGELLPKGTSILTRNRIAPRIAPVVRGVQIIFAPVSLVLNVTLVEPLTRLLAGARRTTPNVTVDELRELVEMSERRRIIDADENAMLSGVVHLGELKVRDVMVPRVDIVAFELQDDPDDLRRVMSERHFTKLPIYDDQIDRMVGLVYAKDLFLDPGCTIQDVIRPVQFVPEVITLTQALHHFQRSGTQLAVAVDEHGGVVGLVTLEDIAEEIVGELTEPEAEQEAASWQQLDERRYRVSGQLSIREWAEQFNVQHFDPRVSTLAGFMVARLGRIPDRGDTVRIGNLLLTVEALNRRRIERILLELVDDSPQAQETAS